MEYILGHQPAKNLEKLIEFVLGGHHYTRRLVITANMPDEISIASPVGNRLANAAPESAFTIPQPEPDPPLDLYVVAIGC